MDINVFSLRAVGHMCCRGNTAICYTGIVRFPSSAYLVMPLEQVAAFPAVLHGNKLISVHPKAG